MSEVLEHEDNNSESARHLATVSTIQSVNPVPDSDRLDVVTFSTNGWSVVMGRSDCKPGDKVCFFEIDSFLPKEERYAILEGRGNKTMNGVDGYRIKSISLRKTLSQGFAMPLSQFPELDQNAPDGTDVTKELNIKLWERPVTGGSFMMGQCAGNFPSHLVPKTDQERIQSIGKRDILDMSKYNWGVTEKCDGTSTTILCYKEAVYDCHVSPETGEAESSSPPPYKFMVCSRNLQIKPPTVETITYMDADGTEHTKEQTVKSVYWDMVNKYGLQEKLTTFCTEHNRQLAIQGEICGQGIQKNPFGLPDVQLFVFDIYDIDKQRYISAQERRAIIAYLDSGVYKMQVPDAKPIQNVPLIGYKKIAPSRDQIHLAAVQMSGACTNNFTIEEEQQEWNTFTDILVKSIVDNLAVEADGKTFNGHGKREGLVFKAIENPMVSFKVISNSYLLAEKD